MSGLVSHEHMVVTNLGYVLAPFGSLELGVTLSIGEGYTQRSG